MFDVNVSSMYLLCRDISKGMVARKWGRIVNFASYVADTGRSHDPAGPAHIRVFDVGAGAALTGGRLFAESTAGLFDGFRVDSEGRVWTSAGDGVHCLAPDGALIGKVIIPEPVANVCFGGPKLNYLYVCGTTSLYGVYLHVNGVKTY